MGLVTKANILDRENGIVEYVASDETLDADGDIALVSGWRFNRFASNSPFLDSHRRQSIEHVLGTVTGARLEGDQLIETVQWAINLGRDLADVGFRMTEAGHLRGVSVGFQPVEGIERKGNRQFVSEAREMGIDESVIPNLQRIFTEQEQTELSAVVVGSNPNALVKSFEDGVIDEGDLHTLGFGGDDAFDLLTKGAQAAENPECSDLIKTMLGIELGKLFADRPRGEEKKTFQETKRSKTGSSSSTPPGDDVAEREAEMRKSFLDQLGQLTSSTSNLTTKKIRC